MLLDSIILTTDDAELAAMFEEHKVETRRHERRLNERLRALGGVSLISTGKDLGAIAVAQIKGISDLWRSDKVVRNARDAFVTEHMEIAAYEVLERSVPQWLRVTLPAAVHHYRSGPLEVLGPGTVSVRSNRNPTRAELPKLRTVADDLYGSLRNPHSVASQLAFFQDRGKCARGCTCASALRFLSRCIAPARGRASERFLRSSSALVELTAGRPA